MRSANGGPTLSLVLLLGLVGGAFALRRALGIEWTAESVRAFVAGFGVLAPLLFIAMVGLRPLLLIPSQILLVAGGIAFGTALGTVYGTAGVFLSGLLAFGLARRWGREAVQARFPIRIQPVLEAVASRWGAALIGVGTAYPVGPVTAYHAGAGLTAMPLLVFGVALLLGAAARAALFTVFGAELAEGNLRGILLAAAGLLLAFALPLLHPGLRRRLTRLVRESVPIDPVP